MRKSGQRNTVGGISSSGDGLGSHVPLKVDSYQLGQSKIKGFWLRVLSMAASVTTQALGRLKRVGGMWNRTALLGLGVCALLQTGCLTYQSSWRFGETIDPESDPVEGRWKGTWLSDHNSHTGSLRAVATRAEGDVQYRFQFGATYMKILRATYDVQFDIEPDGDNFTLTGEQTLPGFMGGLYTYKGRIEGTSFTAKYRSNLDHGTFKMEKAGSL